MTLEERLAIKEMALRLAAALPTKILSGEVSLELLDGDEMVWRVTQAAELIEAFLLKGLEGPSSSCALESF